MKMSMKANNQKISEMKKIIMKEISKAIMKESENERK